jgi:hypothetical protein
MKKCRTGRKGWFGGPFRGPIVLVALPTFISIYLPSQLSAQMASSDSQGDAQEARIDAILATPNLVAPVPVNGGVKAGIGAEQKRARLRRGIEHDAPRPSRRRWPGFVAGAAVAFRRRG